MGQHRSRVAIAALGWLATATILVGCGTGAIADARSSVPSTPVAASPSFALSLDGAVRLTGYASDPAASLNECAPSTSGGWTYSYAGGSPFIVLDLSLYSGAADGSAPSDFDLDIVTPGGTAVRVVPAGRREGAKGSGTATITETDDGAVITIDGTSVSLLDGTDLGGTTVQLAVSCPV